MRRSRNLIAALLLTGLPATVIAQGGAVQWRFEMASPVPGSEVAVGPDGTIYAYDRTTFYALNPDGSTKWTRPGLVQALGKGASIDFLPDGTILTGTDDSITALNPDGTDKWKYEFDISVTNSHLEVGPSVGPDGNIYAVTGIGTTGTGLGAFSLTPSGEFRWHDSGNPPLAPINDSTGGPVFFTQERLIFPFQIVGSGAARVYGYDFTGDQTLYVDFTCLGIPRTDSLNRLLLASACGIEALEQDGNQSYWTVQFGAVNLAPALGADATAYSASWFGDVNAIRPDGSIQWTSTADGAIRMIAVRQDVGCLVYSGADNFGVPDFVRGLDTGTGAVLWTTTLASANGYNEGVWTQRAPTSADGSVVYFTTRFSGDGAPAALYAVRTGDPIVQTAAGLAVGAEAGRLRVVPNPSVDGRVTIDLGRAATPTAARVEIYDLAGRHVRSLLGGTSAGGGRVRWDGRDEAGVPVAAGTYFARLAGPDGASGRITVVR